MSTGIEREIACLLVEALMLEDIVPGEIDPDSALFGDGLGLDSIDALELALAIERRYGVKIQPGKEEAPKIFASLRSLSQYIETNRPPGS